MKYEYLEPSGVVVLDKPFALTAALFPIFPAPYMKRLIFLLIISAFFPCVILAEGELGEKDIVYLDHAELPNDAAIHHQRVLLNELLTGLPEGHRLRLEFLTETPGGFPVRYIHKIVSVTKDDVPDGLEYIFRIHMPVGQISVYKEGRLHGTTRIFKLKNVVGSDGKIHGENYCAKEIPYSEGLVEGVQKSFFPNGKLASRAVYLKGKAEGEAQSYDEDGNPLRVSFMKNGKLHGQMIDYWKGTKQVQRVVSYENGAVHGSSRAYYKSGKLKWEREFKTNELHGVEKHYSEDGNLEKENHWDSGTLIPD
ncbi:MAG: toxin-antitoxin system YwqK family antitoxin [Planctomycetes bacterium]|nr:toxin-antitoxin system YwqK family antitoxin [Planctomycetota bacterium]